MHYKWLKSDEAVKTVPPQLIKVIVQLSKACISLSDIVDTELQIMGKG